MGLYSFIYNFFFFVF